MHDHDARCCNHHHQAHLLEVLNAGEFDWKVSPTFRRYVCTECLWNSLPSAALTPLRLSTEHHSAPANARAEINQFSRSLTFHVGLDSSRCLQLPVSQRHVSSSFLAILPFKKRILALNFLWRVTFTMTTSRTVQPVFAFWRRRSQKQQAIILIDGSDDDWWTRCLRRRASANLF